MASQDDLIREAEKGFSELKSLAAGSWSNLAIVSKVEAVRALVLPIYEALRFAPADAVMPRRPRKKPVVRVATPRPREPRGPAPPRDPEPFSPVHVDDNTRWPPPA